MSTVGSAPSPSLLEAPPLGLGLIRDGRLAFANEALVALMGVPAEHVVGQPLRTLLARAPEGEQLLERHQARLRGERVPDSYEVTVPTPQGTRRVELWVARQGEDWLVMVRDVTARAEHRATLQRLAELGATLMPAHSEQQVLGRVFSGLAAQGLGFGWLVPQGERLRLEHLHLPQHEAAGLEAWPPGARTALLERAWREGAAYGDDLAWEAGCFVEPERAEAVRTALRRLGGLRTIAVRVDVEGVPRALLAVAAPWLREEELPALRLFGAQVSAALESHRLLEEVRGRAEHLALIHEVGRSLVGTLREEQLLEAGVTALARIVDTSDAYVLLPEEAPGGPRLVIRATSGAPPELRGHMLPSTGSCAPSERAWRTRQPVVLEDTCGEPDVPGDLRPCAGGRALMALPLVVHERAVGVATLVETRAPRRFTPAEVERASAIANQLALALEGARLVEDLQKSCAQLERTQQQLVQRERLAALGELSAVVAHEVRNPLGAIFNAVATLRRVLGEASPAVPILDIVGEESERLNRIVDDLLTFGRPASPAPRPVTLEGLLEEAVRRALADATGTVDVVWALEPGVPPVPVDERMMRQAFLNLALNAVQAMAHGGVLRVGVRQAGGERAGVEVEFTDTGPGIPPEARARIFEPFFTTKVKGTGLGLALVKRIIESHAGRLGVESPTGGGTTFRLLLPLELEVPGFTPVPLPRLQR